MGFGMKIRENAPALDSNVLVQQLQMNEWGNHQAGLKSLTPTLVPMLQTKPLVSLGGIPGNLPVEERQSSTFDQRNVKRQAREARIQARFGALQAMFDKYIVKLAQINRISRPFRRYLQTAGTDPNKKSVALVSQRLDLLNRLYDAIDSQVSDILKYMNLIVAQDALNETADFGGPLSLAVVASIGMGDTGIPQSTTDPAQETRVPGIGLVPYNPTGQANPGELELLQRLSGGNEGMDVALKKLAALLEKDMKLIEKRDQLLAARKQLKAKDAGRRSPSTDQDLLASQEKIADIIAPLLAGSELKAF